MKGISLGGISDFTNPKDNRYSKVSLYLEIDEERLRVGDGTSGMKLND